MQQYASTGSVVNKKPTTSPQDIQLQRQPPFNLEAEQALLGAIFIKNEALDSVIDFLEPVHFFDQLHQSIYQHQVDMISAGKRVTPITLMPFFENVPAIDATLTAVGYLGRLAARAPTTMNVQAYGRVIRDMATRRGLIVIGEDIVVGAYESHIGAPPDTLIEEAETRLFALVERGEKGTEVSFEEATKAALITTRDAHAGKKTGIETGLIDIDEKLGGMQRGDLLIVAGRPGMGKTALAINIARHVARTRTSEHPGGIPVGFNSLEMGAEQLALRVLGEMSDVSPDRMRRGKIGASELLKLDQSAPDVAALPITIDPTGSLSIAQLSARARRMKRKRKIELLVVDYLQLMHAGRRTENRVQDVSIITVGLKALAKELNIPVLALSQLSRAVEARDNKRPQLSDLRESGSIEQDADVVMFVFREEYYLDQRKPPVSDVDKYADWNKAKMQAAGKAEVVLAKQRQGSTGIINLQFTDELMRFSSLAPTSASEVRHG